MENPEQHQQTGRKSLLATVAPDPKGTRRRRQRGSRQRPVAPANPTGPLGRGWESVETPKL